MSHWTRIGGYWLIVAILAAKSLRGQSDTTEERIRNDIVRQFPCAGSRFKILRQRTQMPKGACSIARFAAHRIALGDARRLGVTQEDTALIQTASVVLMSFHDLDGGPTERYWLVSFILAGRRLPVNARIDTRTGIVAIENGESS